jgi:acetyl-CoA/propionyl-CoA carboxylase biotin carboxyl carrier protein
VTAVLTKVLVANRGEIARRVIRTLRERGIASVAVFSEADRDALHVREADEAVLIGPAEARQSYLDIDAVVGAALRSGAQAVHPGYGFLSENADFAEACEGAGLVFVGPDSATIRLMGDKRAAKDAVAALGVPVVPGFHGAGADDADLAARCAEIGFPVIVKPSAGGGGKGMRVVNGPDEVAAALASARREALAAFGDDTLLLERYVPRARHVEVQVVGDGAGHVVHLGTRDCSLQRRHQKVVEEAPAPGIGAAVLERMHSDAVAIARSVDYRGVGTVEFVVDAEDPATYYFLEMNTRLQVEHPVTEMVTGLDLVGLQLDVAAGEGLGLTQDQVRIVGHSVEVRVYAEDGHHGFLPSSGRILVLDVPDGVRVDSGVEPGSVVGTSYDPLLAKVISHGANRDEAFDRLDRALAGTAMLGVAHNVGALRGLLADPSVRAAAMTTSLIGDLGLGASAPTSDPHRVVSAALVLAEERERRTTGSVWHERPGWRPGAPAGVRTTLVDEDGHEATVTVHGRSSAAVVAVDDGAPTAAALARSGERITVELDGVARSFASALDTTGPEAVVWIGEGGDAWTFRVPVRHRIHRPDEPDSDGGDLRSPMPGSVVVVAKQAGDAVAEGEVVAVVEAMKMEYPLVSPVAGTVAQVLVGVGSQVVRDQVVAVVEPVG